jgi:hypothetical protein
MGLYYCTGSRLTLTSETLQYLMQLTSCSVENGSVLVYCAGEKGNISEAIASMNQTTLRRV